MYHQVLASTIVPVVWVAFTLGIGRRILDMTGCEWRVPRPGFPSLCRCYNYAEDQELAGLVKQHIGTHGAMLDMVGRECHDHLESLAIVIADALRFQDPAPLTIVTFCRGGEKRSVALATVMYHCVKAVVGVAPEHPEHMCSQGWHRTCRGNCHMCRNALGRTAADNPGIVAAVEHFQMVLRSLMPPERED